MPDQFLEACTWECMRQNSVEMQAMYGKQKTVKTPELNKLRLTYLETSVGIAKELDPNVIMD